MSATTDETATLAPARAGDASRRRPFIERVRSSVFRFVEGDYTRAQLHRSLLPYLTACSPAIATSIFAPAWLAWLMAVLSLVALYRITTVLDAALFAVSLQRGVVAYVLPLNGLLLLWCAALAGIGRGAWIPSTAFAHGAVLCLVIAPACRRNRRRMARRVPLRWSYAVLAGIVIVMQGAAGLAALIPTAAHAAMYRCPSEHNDGTTIVTNVLHESDATRRSCVVLNTRTSTLDAVTAPTPGVTPGRRARAGAVAQSAEYRIAPGTQRLRDDDRRTLLQEELRREEEALSATRSNLQTGTNDDGRLAQEALSRHAANIESVKRELARIR